MSDTHTLEWGELEYSECGYLKLCLSECQRFLIIVGMAWDDPSLPSHSRKIVPIYSVRACWEDASQRWGIVEWRGEAESVDHAKELAQKKLNELPPEQRKSLSTDWD